MPINNNSSYTGIALAVIAVIIWSGNFIVARAMYEDIPPVALAFFRWLLATLLLLPITINVFRNELNEVKANWKYLFWVSLTGVALFNTFVYIGAHYTSAINLALIGTTSSPVMAIIMARIFLHEKIGWPRLAGLVLCISGVLFLLSNGNLKNLLTLHFGKGDLWVLLAAFCFAVYNTLVKKKPKKIPHLTFLVVIFSFGTLLLLPFYIWESLNAPAILWNRELIFSIVYLALGASVICYWIWNIAIHKLGAARTILFGNLIPVFSTLGSVLILHEKFTGIHLISMIIVFSGIIMANLHK